MWILKSPQIIVEDDKEEMKPKKDINSSNNTEMLAPEGLYMDAKFNV